MDIEEAVDMAEQAKETGFKAVKFRLTGGKSDQAFVESVSARLPDHLGLMFDLNEKGSPEHVLRISDALLSSRALWLEEPFPADDLDSHLLISKSPGPSIAIGEHLQGHDRFAPYLDIPNILVIQPDLAMMGGITECLRLVRQCHSMPAKVAPHFLPDLFIHLAATSDAVIWLEDFPLLEVLFKDPLNQIKTVS